MKGIRVFEKTFSYHPKWQDHQICSITCSLARLRSSVEISASLHVLVSQANGLTIQVGEEPEAVLGVEVSDERRPSFRISYPKLIIKRNRDQHTSTVQADGVLAEGVAWVVEQLARHGVVKPEFSD